MKKIYYQKDKTKVVAIDTKKIATHSIYAKDYVDAQQKLKNKHVHLSSRMERRLSTMFSSKEAKFLWISQLNDLIGQSYVNLVNFLKKIRVKVLGIFAITGLVNYLTLSWMKTNIFYLSHIKINHASKTDNFMNLPLILTIFCILFLLFLIPKKKYNVIAMFIALVIDTLFFWIDKDSFVNFDSSGFYFLRIDKSVLENTCFLVLLLVTVFVVSLIVYDTFEAIYKWLVGTNKSIEAPKLSLIWAIVAFLLGLLLK